ncbi:Mov34/MPN/PAD-1 family protein [Pseudobutyrivibrio sp.]|uniref:Mov34/MPN/PAD-1 family protein n=1 Tax=Pseudobutyrivibrio sp. TaxID=2014367 RepID=UPI00386D07D6
MLQINKEAFFKLTSISEAQYPNEACGVLLGNSDLNQVNDVCNLPNLLGETDSFRIDSLDYLMIEKWAQHHHLDVIGFFHSHPDAAAILSEEDKTYMIPKLNYCITSVASDGTKQVKTYFRQNIWEGIEELEINVK